MLEEILFPFNLRQEYSYISRIVAFDLPSRCAILAANESDADGEFSIAGTLFPPCLNRSAARRRAGGVVSLFSLYRAEAPVLCAPC
jgi:hypothetical protein